MQKKKEKTGCKVEERIKKRWNIWDCGMIIENVTCNWNTRRRKKKRNRKKYLNFLMAEFSQWMTDTIPQIREAQSTKPHKLQKYLHLMKVKVSQSCPTLWSHGLYPPWNSPDQNTGVDSRSLLQWFFSTQGSNPGLPHCRRILYQLSHRGSPGIL